ncbi:hypothetical protein ACO0K9_10280 [Undibacterium sp. Ji50W]|uniref:hypothetical protein n=1 Tax=Undibacterium sp. Ji50W TaxID=3413041 RepID=UPI003BF09CBB
MISRIPLLKSNDLHGLQLWFAEMEQRGILFHPDDDPADMVVIKTGESMFTDFECGQLKSLIDIMFQMHGDQVYEVAYPVFMTTFKPEGRAQHQI